jgi:hypothetical protein
MRPTILLYGLQASWPPTAASNREIVTLSLQLLQSGLMLNTILVERTIEKACGSASARKIFEP